LTWAIVSHSADADKCVFDSLAQKRTQDFIGADDANTVNHLPFVRRVAIQEAYNFKPSLGTRSFQQNAGVSPGADPDHLGQFVPD
jgi:hypothetical protein